MDLYPAEYCDPGLRAAFRAMLRTHAHSLDEAARLKRIRQRDDITHRLAEFRAAGGKPTVTR